MHRLGRVAGSLAVVLVAYWAYALVAVPLIEPPADPRRDQPISEVEQTAARERIDAGIAELKGLFPPGAWELNSPKILESDQFKLLMQDYRNLGGGRVEIRPCTMVFTPKGPAGDQAQRNRQAVILEAPDGALLEFDQPFDLRQMKIGRLVGGRLIGRTTMRSAGKQPGPEDDLLAVTRDVQVTEKEVTTPHTVDFHYGPHYGRGAQMRIKLLSGDQASGGDRREPSIAGIELFELRRLERLHLELGKLKLVRGKTPGAPANRRAAAASGGSLAGSARRGGGTGPTGKPPAEPASDLPVEVTCQGPFCFDVLRKVATFKEQVDVLRINPTGPSDQLNCELLSVFFSDRIALAPGGPNHAGDDPKKRPAGSLNLQPQRIEARGDPVVVHAPSQRVHARGQRLEYDLQTGRIVLDGTHEVMLQQAPNEIHARSLQYQPAAAGSLGRILARGPGWLRGQMDRQPAQPLEARWNEQLQVRPDEENQVISLSGGAGLRFRGIGQLDAGEIHIWLLPSKPQRPDAQSSWRPDRMLARQDVRIQSPELSGAVREQLEVWFEPAARPEGGSSKADGERGKAESGQRKAEGAPSARQHGNLSPTVSGPATVAQPASAPTARQQHFQIAGRLLRARMLLQEDGRTGLSELTVQDGVEFVETQTKQPDERPLLVRGDRLHLVDADKPYAAVTVSGGPAHFQGRGLALAGPNINLNRGTNRLWIDGAGRMDLVMDRDLEGRPLRSPGLLQVHWQDGMLFDGRTARFEEAVTVTAPDRYLQTETLEVQLKQPIDFSGGQTKQQPKIEQLLCRGGVFMESLSFDGEIQTSHERMQVPDLAVNLDSGALTAGGPGWLTSVRLRSDDPLGARAGGLAAGVSPSDTTRAPPDGYTVRRAPDALGTADASHDQRDTQLRGLHVRFQGSISGNVLEPRRELTFREQVHTAYAPVDSWAATLDVNDPDSLGEGGVLMHCDRLSVNEMPTPDGHRRTLELLADGNIVVEGSSFTARAIRMTYAEIKHLLILEGDGRTDAVLFRQQQVGGPTSEFPARKIFYWPRTGQFKAEGARSLQVDQLPTGNRGRQ
jgi:hypothetical protein